MTTTDRITAQIERLKAKQAQLEARQRAEAKKRTTHAHIVAGAVLLSRPDAFGLDADRVRAVLDQVVTRDHDRRALGLPERAA